MLALEIIGGYVFSIVISTATQIGRTNMLSILVEFGAGMIIYNLLYRGAEYVVRLVVRKDNCNGQF